MVDASVSGVLGSLQPTLIEDMLPDDGFAEKAVSASAQAYFR